MGKYFTTEESGPESFTMDEMLEANEEISVELFEVLDRLKVGESVEFDGFEITRVE